MKFDLAKLMKENLKQIKKIASDDPDDSDSGFSSGCGSNDPSVDPEPDSSDVSSDVSSSSGSKNDYCSVVEIYASSYSCSASISLNGTSRTSGRDVILS